MYLYFAKVVKVKNVFKKFITISYKIDYKN